MPTLKYSISTIAPGSINYASVRRIKIVDNISGDVHLFPADSTYIFMKVFVTNSDYRFYFQFPREDQQLIIMISELNDINGTAPAGNNQTTDLASIISLINV
jgi:hypothetical protein